MGTTLRKGGGGNKFFGRAVYKDMLYITQEKYDCDSRDLRDNQDFRQTFISLAARYGRRPDAAGRLRSRSSCTYSTCGG